MAQPLEVLGLCNKASYDAVSFSELTLPVELRSFKPALLEAPSSYFHVNIIDLLAAGHAGKFI